MKLPKVVGIIPDGNKRYGKLQGWTLEQTYKEWAMHLTQVCQWFCAAGVKEFVIYVCSTDNLTKRPAEDVDQISKHVEYVKELFASFEQANDAKATLLINHDPHDKTDHNVDLIVRTGKRERLSGFPSSPYSEIRFVDKYFPELTQRDVEGILESYANTERTFGG